MGNMCFENHADMTVILMYISGKLSAKVDHWQTQDDLCCHKSFTPRLGSLLLTEVIMLLCHINTTCILYKLVITLEFH